MTDSGKAGRSQVAPTFPLLPIPEPHHGWPCSAPGLRGEDVTQRERSTGDHCWQPAVLFQLPLLVLCPFLCPFESPNDLESWAKLKTMWFPCKAFGMAPLGFSRQERMVSCVFFNLQKNLENHRYFTHPHQIPWINWALDDSSLT